MTTLSTELDNFNATRKFIANVVNQSIDDNPRITRILSEPSMCKVLEIAFNWATSPEGRIYWQLIYRTIYKIESKGYVLRNDLKLKILIKLDKYERGIKDD